MFRGNPICLSLGAVSALACSAPRPPPASPPSAAPTVAPDPITRAVPLTGRELELRAELEGLTAHLVDTIGERNATAMWELAEAADWVANEFERDGYEVRRQGYAVGDEVMAQNLEVQVRGGRRGDQIVVVGAHYDSPAGSPGASDATGLAALLALSRSLKAFHPLRTLRFVAFGTSQSLTGGDSSAVGSAVYAQAARAAHDNLHAVVSLDSLGYFTDAEGSQQAPAGLEGTVPTRGNFIAFVGDLQASDLADGMLNVFTNEASIAAYDAILITPDPQLGPSDALPFADLGIPAIRVTDTARLRHRGHGTNTDTLDHLDLGRAARVVAGLERALQKLAGKDRPLPSVEDPSARPAEPPAPAAAREN